MLSIDDLSVNYGPVKALSRVSIDVPRGEVTAVIGANGAGKSTLMRTLAGLVKPASGSAQLDGNLITGHKPEDIVRMGVALVPEGRSTIPELTVDENLRLGGMWRSRAEREASHAEVYDLFPVLGERSRMRADTLSGGERQQLAIGRALMCAPECLLLDEPSLGLSPLFVKNIFEIIKEINRQGITILLVEQNVFQSLRIAHRAYVLETGRVVLSGTGEELLGNEHVKRAFLGA